MGSGPTSYLASLKACHSILLMSPFMSIKDAAKDLFGWGGFMNWMVIERFRNIEYIAKAKCPCFFMHGLKDTLIPFNHSVELNKVCPTVSFLHLIPEMDHNEFKIMEDLILPFKKFVSQLDASNTQPIKIV